MMQSKKFIILAGPSGAGKTTVFDKLYEEYDHKISNSFKLDVWISNLYNSDPFLKNLIDYLFGDLYENGKINKDKLFNCYLKYPSKLVLVRHYIDYLFWRRLTNLSPYSLLDEGQDIVLIEASNWFDFEICSNLYSSHVIWITADDCIRFNRLISRVGEDKAKKIFKLQDQHLTVPKMDQISMVCDTSNASFNDTYDVIVNHIKEIYGE